LTFECVKIAKNLTFKKKCQKKCHFFNKIEGNFVEKRQFFEINVKFLAIFLTFKWQLSGVSASRQLLIMRKH